MPLDQAKLEKVVSRGEKTIARCPACFAAGQDKTGNHLVIFPDGSFGCTANPGDKEHRRQIAQVAGDSTDSWKNEPPGLARAHRNGSAAVTTLARTEVCAYPYKDAQSATVYEVVRYDPKDFRPFRVVDGIRADVAGLGKLTRLPYRLPELIASGLVWIVEGEKDADNLAALGIVATCRAGGSSGWEPELTPWFKDKDVVFCGDNDDPGRKFAQIVESAIKPVAKSFRTAHLPPDFKDISEALEGLSDTEAKERVESLLIPQMSAVVKSRLFDISKPPKRTDPVLWINGIGIAKPGDLVVIQAQSKSGKSALLGAMMGCLMANGLRSDRDFLGVSGTNPYRLPVVHFDTEQSPEDHWDLISRSLKRALLDDKPDWFESCYLTDCTIKARRKEIVSECSRLKSLHNRCCAILVDGIADICEDVNDATEANNLVDEMYSIAIHNQCPVICVLHENHGTLSGKTRGHLGSQLERKAASNLRLEKVGESGMIQLWGEKLRRGHIGKGHGPHFIWNDEEQMHVSCDVPEKESKEPSEAKADRMRKLAIKVFQSQGTLRHSELHQLIERTAKVSERTAKSYIGYMRDNQLLTYFEGLKVYSLKENLV